MKGEREKSPIIRTFWGHFIISSIHYGSAIVYVPPHNRGFWKGWVKGRQREIKG